MQLEAYLERDDRIVLPIGSTEQHAYLSLATDNILAERVAVEAAEPLGVLVLPVLPYGITPRFAAYPGSPTLRVETFVAVVTDLLDSLSGQGFRRILIVNGHGGNVPARSVASQWGASHAETRVRYHDWWNSEKVMTLVRSVDSEGSHASWMENFPWTRLPGVELPSESKPSKDPPVHDPVELRKIIGDGSFGGPYAHSDEDMLRIWEAGVEEVRALLEDGW
jgi:creatinine amidohydrolase